VHSSHFRNSVECKQLTKIPAAVNGDLNMPLFRRTPMDKLLDCGLLDYDKMQARM
jgi:hypothetical protein